MRTMTKSWPLPDATETAAMIRRRDITALEAVDEAIVRAEALQPALNFMVMPLFEQARERAKLTSLIGPFAGVPYLIKDMYDVKGAPTRWGSRFTSRLPVAAKSSQQVQALEAAGLILIGKSSLGEMGFLPTTEPVGFGPTNNPWDITRSPGGSSGGAAAAVAAGILPMADAADGGGSIRIPASACGLFGLKPSRHRLIGQQTPAGGVVVTSEHCVSRTVRDSAALFASMERTGQAGSMPFVGPVTGPSKRRLRIGYVFHDYNGRAPDAEVLTGLEKTIKLLQELGHIVEPTQRPFDSAALLVSFSHLFMMGAQQAVGMARASLAPKPLGMLSLALQLSGLVPGGIGPMPDTTMIEEFTLALSRIAADFPRGETGRIKKEIIRAEAQYDQWYESFDVIFSPVLRTPPVKTGHIVGNLPFEVLWERLLDYAMYTEIDNMLGTPAMSVPLHWTAAGLPVGMHFAARKGDERTLFELAYELEDARPWALRAPPVNAFRQGVGGS
ncbi:amidase family protein [Phyllobacterium sp. OV277]|uniref:amidase family protein n=1 Tax=Phyllobacterium sp. OV277 TaxID=1882772 RepID=UPI00088D7D4C|nr:amidase family protein [Phyllobacterium sp. OV277]SDP68390.1 amidase [Phyllobacterium sp. OV277]